MEISTVPVSGVPQFNTPPVIKTASTDSAPVPVPPQPQVQIPVANTGAAGAAISSGTTYQQAVSQQDANAAREAALSFKNVYAVSDTSSVTFKDATGAYITRVVNLRDNTVTYVPKPQYLRPSQATSDARIFISA